MGKNVFDLITDSLTNERLDDILLQNPEYLKTMDEIDELAENLESCNLDEKETKAVNRLICAYLTQNDCHSNLAYQQGFKDCASLLQEIGTIQSESQKERNQTNGHGKF